VKHLLRITLEHKEARNEREPRPILSRLVEAIDSIICVMFYNAGGARVPESMKTEYSESNAGL
jgi:hypothetical protein